MSVGHLRVYISVGHITEGSQIKKNVEISWSYLNHIKPVQNQSCPKSPSGV